jgi:hypothetical protein
MQAAFLRQARAGASGVVTKLSQFETVRLWRLTLELIGILKHNRSREFKHDLSEL